MTQEPNPVPQTEKFSVCGFDTKHGYYRNKLGTYLTEAEALDKLKAMRLDPTWRISTIIVRQIYSNQKSQHLDLADRQQRIWACSCKQNDSRIYARSDFGRFTY